MSPEERKEIEKVSIRYGIYALEDRLSGFNPQSVFVQYNDAVALRSFRSLANSPQRNAVNECPADVRLVRLGWFDITKGELSPDFESFGYADQYREVKS